ncbi:hypothetical protein B0H16DRAFT_1603719 [Mycena metata]|uniref:Uncharacterized protein n=1 Tax=Mycena metata TaxID=1033252 RepID=A0AAD7HHI4_9AGAR|nr:hypothetical protein B0H16DRAFT_1603719 [Mycena metata]
MSTSGNLTTSALRSLVVTTVGPMILGGVFQSILFGVISVQTFCYYSLSKFRRYAVGVLLLLNAFQFGTSVDIAFRAGTWFEDGKMYFLEPQTWTMCIQPAITAIVVFVAQLIFLDQSCVVKRARGLLALLGPLILLSLASGVAYSVIFFKVGNLNDVGQLGACIDVWLISMLLTEWTFFADWWLTIQRSGLSQNEMIPHFGSLVNSTFMTSVVVFGTLTTFRVFGGTYYLAGQFSIGSIFSLAVFMRAYWDPTLGPRHNASTSVDAPVSTTQTQTIDVMTYDVDCQIETLVEGEPISVHSIYISTTSKPQTA